MARMARVVAPNFPHHITQRGNRRQQTFFSNDDYLVYLDLLACANEKADVDIWAYCLMPNHVHVVAVPYRENSLAKLFSDVHRRYTRRINFREGWRGHLWQERFHSFVMDEQYLLATVRYVELNPVRARLCKRPEEWRWSSVHAHLRTEDDRLVSVRPMLERVRDWQAYLQQDGDKSMTDDIRQHTRTGRPAGNDNFLSHLELTSRRTLRRKRPGPKRKLIK